MKICFLGDATSIHIKRWCEFFRDNGDEVTLISFTKDTIPGVNVVYAGENLQVNSQGGNFKYLSRVMKIKSIIKKLNPDILNAHYLTSYGLIGSLLKLNIPYVVSTWGSDILVTPKKNAIYKYMTKYVLNKCDLVTSDSNFMSEEIYNFGISKNKVLTMPMGIEPSIFNRNDSCKGDSVKKFLSMRTLCKNSNIDIIVQAFARLANEYEDVKLIIVNDGTDRKYIEDIIQNTGLKDKIELRGSVQRNIIVTLLKSCDYYISIPTSDSTSVSLLEAMACGIFPIVSNIPANNEWIKDKYNGLVIENDGEQLYQAFKYVMNEKELLNNASEINSKIISERAIWNDNMGATRDAYLRLIK